MRVRRHAARMSKDPRVESEDDTANGRTRQTLFIARSHSAPGWRALRTKTMTAMSTVPGSIDSGIDSDERSQTAE